MKETLLLKRKQKPRVIEHQYRKHTGRTRKDGFDKADASKEIQIVVTTNFEIDSFVKGYHEYKNIWTPKIGETLSIEREPGNLVDKYAVCVNKNNEIVGHLPLGKDGKFAKTVFYFLRADEFGSCDVLIKGKPANFGDGDGMQVPCSLNFTGRKKFIVILEKTLKL